MTKINKLLIANRGEISSRIQKTCQRLGIATVAVYSEADANATFVLSANERYCIGKPEPHLSYLNQAAIISACKQSGAQAVHPGYGFLSENSSFAKALEENGILFLGPRASSIDLMGDKIRSREAMSKAGVPVVPGFSSDSKDPEFFLKEAKKIGFPVMIKATAGGGGKGMRKVDKEEDFIPFFEAAVREAEKAFGNGLVFLEKYISNPRHIEFQIFGDSHGNVIHLHERDCSIQRRHQKVLEETPAPNFPREWKEKMATYAILAGQSIQYLGAGTVEFILGEDGSFYFLEMNTRLQVEHPITEMVTGLDLVELQIRIAEGESIPNPLLELDGIPQNGHAIEVRVYAEDPSNGFLPSIGKIEYMKCPSARGIRLDTGVDTGSEVSIYYDPMIGKLIAHAEDRDTCRKKLLQALRKFVIFGPTTNISFLQNILQEPEFIEGRATTHFLEGKGHLTLVEESIQMESLSWMFQLSQIPIESESIWRAVDNAFQI
jgi:3-methylcrotonyl-CoA carboxylase alpha subunit